MKKIDKLPRGQTAFTIIELLIATAVVSTILLLATGVFVNINGLYYKGIDQSKIQTATRTITDYVAQDLRLSDSGFSAGSGTATLNGTSVTVYSYCIGSIVRYSYVLGHEIGSGTDTDNKTQLSPHVIWRDDGQDIKDSSSLTNINGSCLPVDITKRAFNFLSPTGIGKELAIPNSRLTTFDILGSSPYSVSLGMAYGSIDLLTNLNPDQPSPTARCSGIIGDQYCATSILQTVAVRILP